MGVIYNEGDKVVVGPGRIKYHWGRVPWSGSSTGGSSFNPSDAPTDRAGYSEIERDYEAYYDIYEWKPDDQGAGVWDKGEAVSGDKAFNTSRARSSGRQAALSSIGTSKVGDGYYASMDDVPSYLSEESTDYGAPSIDRDDFFDASGERKGIGDVMTLIKDTFPDLTQDDTQLQKIIEDQLPSLSDVPTEETGFLAEQYGGATGIEDDPGTPGMDESQVSFAESLAGERAGQALETGMTQVQRGAQTLGQQMQGAGGMGGGMRGQIAGAEAISGAFEATQDKYGLAEREADLAARKGAYGLEKDRFDEGEFRTFLAQFTDSGV